MTTSISKNRASVLVLVMTLLSILFVLGVAFLATMNFEAEQLLAESRQRQGVSGVDTVAEGSGQLLGELLMADSSAPFGDGDSVFSLSGSAELPGWHNMSSPIEPSQTDNGDVVWGWFTDLEGLTRPPWICLGGVNDGDACEVHVDCPGNTTDCGSDQICKCVEGPEAKVCDGGDNERDSCADDSECAGNGRCRAVRFNGPAWRNVRLDATWPNGSEYIFHACNGGTNDRQSCVNDADCPGGRCDKPLRQWCQGGAHDGQACISDPQCPGGRCVERGVIVVDADGDGVIDTVQVDARRMGFTDGQIAQLSSVVNPSSNTTGRVFVGLRMVPHGGMVNLNESHPLLIKNVLGVDELDELDKCPPDPDLGEVCHRPSLRNARTAEVRLKYAFYSPLQEEATLRRRSFLPPRIIPPSLLHGNGLMPAAARRGMPDDRGDMPMQLFPFDHVKADYESVLPGQHRFWPIRPDETLDSRNLDGPNLWAMRMEPIYSQDNDTGGLGEYDQRHLLTTASHDDLLGRGGRVLYRTFAGADPRDIRQAMMEVNEEVEGNDDCAFALPFEYANYPHDIPNATVPNEEGEECLCPTNGPETCRFDRRKGRLKLSLPWLDEAISKALNAGGITIEQRNRLIHEAFFMLLNNAAGPYWEDQNCATRTCLLSERCGTSEGYGEVCLDSVTGEPRRLARIARTAASLTANMIDYMDDRVCVGGMSDGYPCNSTEEVRVCQQDGGSCGAPDTPTRIALRSFDFSGPRYCVQSNGTLTANQCISKDDCGGSEYCETIGQPIGLLGGKARPVQHVYGLEKQPFITEVATVLDNNTLAIVARAVEVFNPYEDLNASGTSEFYLVEVPSGVVPTINGDGTLVETTGVNYMLLPGYFRSNTFTVFKSDDMSNGGTGKFNIAEGARGTDGYVYRFTDGPKQLSFMTGSTLYLVLRITYPGDSLVSEIVLDQVTIKTPVGDTTAPLSGVGTGIFADGREVAASSPWTVPVPVSPTTPPTEDVHTLGDWNSIVPPLHHPVEIRFANTGSFSGTIPNAPTGRENEVAFPTTGSMLMLMRHANRSLSDLTLADPVTGMSAGAKDQLAFTAHLDDETDILEPGPGGQLISVGIIKEYEQVDNGRMPVFDIGSQISTGVVYYPAHHVHPRNSRLGRPGGVENLPWGQLVYDYFTALPLSNAGPYRGTNQGAPDAQPRVDLRGLRVHGRIDLNAAPWTVLAGLPLIPMEKISLEYRPKIRRALGLVGTGAPDQLNPPDSEFNIPDDQAKKIDDDLAQGIVAYREARGLPFSDGPSLYLTGNYGSENPADGPLGSRAWRQPDPMSRRGTGLLTVGELANVRFRESGGRHIADNQPINHPTTGNPFLGFSYYRVDGGFLDAKECLATPGVACETNADCVGGACVISPLQDYVGAVAMLVALGDWVTVRSHVFTTYGVVRGELDDSLQPLPRERPGARVARQSADVDARALRFQETVDRLPTFLGERVPGRIGQRVLSRYTDTQSD